MDAKKFTWENIQVWVPIDPQIGGIPAHGVVDEFKRASDEIKADPDKFLVWQPILSKYQPAFIGHCEKALAMVEGMVKDWLSTGMFEGEDDAEAKGSYIARMLVDYEFFKSHDRHIRPEDCQDIGLKIRLLEEDSDLQDAVLSVHHACIHTLSGSRAYKIIETTLEKRLCSWHHHRCLSRSGAASPLKKNPVN